MATSIFHHNFPETAELQKKADAADFIIGLDLHKKTTAICVIDLKKSDKPCFQRKRVANIQLLETLSLFPGKKIVVAEASYGWGVLKSALDAVEHVTLVLFDTRKTAAWVKSSGIKNDTVDAQVLAYAALHGGIPRLSVYQPDPEHRCHFKLSQLRETLVRQRSRVKNQLKAIDREYGPNPYTGEIPVRSDAAKGMHDLLLDQLGELNTHIKGIEKRMQDIAENDSIIPLLRSIPCVGPLTAFALRFKIGNIDRFKSPQHISSYFGFAVRQWQSGDGETRGKITKHGDSLIRKLLIQGTQILRNSFPHILELYFPHLANPHEMKFSKHANKVVVAAARKHLTFVYHAWKKQQPFDIKKYAEQRLCTSNNILAPSSSPSSLLSSPSNSC